MGNNLLIIWYFTIVASFGIEIVTDLKKFKDAADRGYKFNIIKFDLMKNNNKRSRFINLGILELLLLINIIFAISKSVKYNKNKSEIIQKFLDSGLLVEMKEEEIEEYQKSKNALTAYEISSRSADDTYIDDVVNNSDTTVLSQSPVLDSVQQIPTDCKEMIEDIEVCGFVPLSPVDDVVGGLLYAECIQDGHASSKGDDVRGRVKTLGERTKKNNLQG